jgi:pimeloyl-ACP methyl ester carboxylesterase
MPACVAEVGFWWEADRLLSFLKDTAFRGSFAADVSDADAAFLRDAQVPISMNALKARVTRVAWKSKPSWYVVAKDDRAIAPALLRRTARRIRAVTTEVSGSHLLFLSQAKAVAAVIEEAARGAAAARQRGR